MSFSSSSSPVRTRLVIKVIPNAKKNTIEYIDETHLKIRINVSPERGKANNKVIKLLAKELKISKKDIRIVSGEFNRHKILEIANVSGSIKDRLKV